MTLFISACSVIDMLQPAQAATIWNGQKITFTKAGFANPSQAANQDRITDNVWLTRGSSAGLYNAAMEGGWDGFNRLSPLDTEWALGTTANTNLTYQTWEATFGGQFNLQGFIVGKDAVLHLISDDIYIDIKFISWGGSVSGGAFSYERSTPSSGNVAPTVTLISPTDGAEVGAPATLLIQATADDTDGAVTQVAFFDGATLLGSDVSGPDYELTANLLPGGHTLTAVATDNEGAATTSSPVTITVTNTIITNPFVQRVPKGNLTIEVQTIADGMASPLGMAVPDDGSGRMFVYDQAGPVWIVTAAGRKSTPLLDVSGRLVTLGAYDERGLLGFAAHPNFSANAKVYTYTSEPFDGPADFANGLGTTNNHQSVIAEWSISEGSSNVVDVASRREVLRVDQPQGNHNGGAMHFGPDGLLYVVLGDGGQANDVAPGHVPGGNGQESNNIWGTMLRIDVDGSNSANGQYGIPGDNPFVGTAGVDESFAYGFRNPFSFSFDKLTGEIYLGDVGQGRVEEVDLITSGGNYGWNIKEGTFWFDGAGNIVAAPVRPVPPDLIDPIAMYDHDDGLAIIGGYMYRGNAISNMVGRYVFGDWGSFSAPSGRLYYLDDANGVKEFRLGSEDRPLGMWLKGWGQDANGELYAFGSKALGPSGSTGRMLKLIPAPAQLEITSNDVTKAGEAQINWTGGWGPFAAQRKASLTDPLWMDSPATTANSRTEAASGTGGLFRVADLAHQHAIPLSAFLAGDFENPPVSTSASGLGLFSLDGNTLSFSLNYSGLSGSASAAHIHGAAGVGTNASVLIDLGPFAGSANGATGTYAGVLVLSDAQKALVLSGLTYVNVHTAAHGSGEIRGQIVPVLMQIGLSGGNQRPHPVVTPGRGLGTAALVGNTLTLNLTYGGLTAPATASHIHGPATVDQSAGVLVNLVGNVEGSYGSRGSLSGPVMLTPSQLGHVINGRTYVNIHTGTNPGGEIRGQILCKPSAIPLTAALSGLAQRPTPVTNSASGSATFLLEGHELTFNLQYESLSGVATAAHIHGPAPASQPAGVLLNLEAFNANGFGTDGTLSGTVTLTDGQRRDLLAGQTYVNLHTALNPGGEIRGQIAPMLMMAHLSGANERPTANTSPGNGLGVLTLCSDRLSLVVAYNNLMGTATGSHIHGPASHFGTASVLVDLGPFNGGAFGSSGALSGTTPLTPDQLGSIVDGQTYINIHTAANPGGEIRGQILR